MIDNNYLKMVLVKIVENLPEHLQIKRHVDLINVLLFRNNCKMVHVTIVNHSLEHKVMEKHVDQISVMRGKSY